MINFDKVPRVIITHSPTPIELAPRLSAALGRNLYIKRDDCTGLAGGGNKTRKLEYLLAEAKSLGADTLITIGGIQSNHARQTAAAAAKFGFDCELVLEDVEGTPKTDYYNNGNVLLDSLLGATIHRLKVGEDTDVFAESLANQLKSQGKKPYLIPVGGSNVTGSLGYVRCAYEVLQQLSEQNLKIDRVIHATCSAGTQAGFLAGLIMSQVDLPLLGISASLARGSQEELVETLLKQVLLRFEVDPARAQGKVIANSDYVGDGYGIPTSQMIEAVKVCAQLEGLLLDPVYSGKAMAGLIDLCEKAEIPEGSNLLFLHTGGSPGLFSYREIF
jgi:D-cysteine desulfhydrase/L-cysteate sulfo-lyase